MTYLYHIKQTDRSGANGENETTKTTKTTISTEMEQRTILEYEFVGVCLSGVYVSGCDFNACTGFQEAEKA